MSESEQFPSNMLTAEELLKNKGISSNAWKEYDTSSKALPKTGQKQFEPNDSWLQKIQIETDLKNRKELLSIERVDRSSQLAIAEWLPLQKKARVKKSSGQDWNSFGLEKNGALYLIPEEALFLLEANSLELLWNDVPLSIQQAYELLIDNVECSIEEYRVYSQLVRYGYKIQRYVYTYSDKDEINVKRKVIIDPENGLRMADKQLLDQNTESVNNRELRNEITVLEQKENCTSALEDNSITDISVNVSQVVEDLLQSVESIEQTGTKSHLGNQLDKQTSSQDNDNKEKRKPRLEIISDETFLNEIKIIKDSSNSSPKQDGKATSPRGWRIQRNVKVVPKRVDKPLSSHTTPSDSNTGNTSQCSSAKHKLSAESDTSLQTKKPKLEVIVLSDDEVQELPKPVSRKELLDLLPNIASKETVVAKIAKQYIPSNIKPQKSVYYYKTDRLRQFHNGDQRPQPKPTPDKNNFNHVTQYNTLHRSDMFNWLPFPYQSALFLNPNITNQFIPRNFFPTRFFTYFPQQFYNRHPIAYGGNRYSNSHKGNQYPSRQSQESKEVYRPSFKTIPETTSWSELKAKWGEEKTVTIDDEDNTNETIIDSDVQVVGQCTNPLIGSTNVSSLTKVFERLRIIKSAPEKMVRRKRGKYKISYNIYSNTQHYTKGNPGRPLYRVVVKGQKDDQFVQPIELLRLFRDSNDSPIVLACVSMSISYIQPGFINVPDIL